MQEIDEKSIVRIAIIHEIMNRKEVNKRYQELIDKDNINNEILYTITEQNMKIIEQLKLVLERDFFEEP
jgi:DNA-binding protein H-NS